MSFMWGFVLLLTLPLLVEGEAPAYTLAMQWPAGACVGRKCSRGLPDRFTIRGLWSFEQTNGVVSHGCLDPSVGIGTFNVELIQDLVEELEVQWPSFTGPSIDFWKDAWERHGACSNLSQHEYFDATLHLAKKYDLMVVFEEEGVDPSKDTSFYSDSFCRAIEEIYGKVANVISTYTRPDYLKEVHMCFSEHLELVNCEYKSYVYDSKLSLKFSLKRTLKTRLKKIRRSNKHIPKYTGLVSGIGLLGWWYRHMWKKYYALRRIHRTE